MRSSTVLLPVLSAVVPLASANFDIYADTAIDWKRDHLPMAYRILGGEGDADGDCEWVNRVSISSVGQSGRVLASCKPPLPVNESKANTIDRNSTPAGKERATSPATSMASVAKAPAARSTTQASRSTPWR